MPVPHSNVIVPRNSEQRCALQLCKVLQVGDTIQAKVLRTPMRKRTVKRKLAQYVRVNGKRVTKRKLVPVTVFEPSGEPFPEWHTVEVLNIDDPASIVCRAKAGGEFRVGILCIRPYVKRNVRRKKLAKKRGAA